ncbi:MAG: HD domain-containing protein [Treponema sp.]|jgi:exopolyphosphatase/guanosine-5'-triphosphate,3'-diphosphate pyrophosphatase|nr:HD domain-containing protein [Treponema sp.]
MFKNSPLTARPVAVMEIGSTGIRLLVAKITGAGGWKELDRAGKPVALGRDVFTSGMVSRASLLECLSILRNFKELLVGWDIAEHDVHLIATSALRAAHNRDIFVDRVFQETGYRLAIVEGVEENRLVYLAIRFALKNTTLRLPFFWSGSAMIIDIGGGSTEIMLLRHGKMVAAHSIRVGTIVLDQHSRKVSGILLSRERYLIENFHNTILFLQTEMPLDTVDAFVVTGSDTRIAASLIEQDETNNDWCHTIERERFLTFIKEVKDYSIEDCVQKLHITYGDAEGFVPGLLVYKYFLEQTKASQVVVPVVSIREGLLVDIAMGVDPDLREDFFSQIIASAMNLGRKYHFDEAHGRQVALLSRVIFDFFSKEHGINRHERILLEIAALLHDIGMFVKGSSHHKHGQYIIANSEIFGLRQEELDIIGNIIRYHREDSPSSDDVAYIALQREERVLVLKMTSILRVSDALDRGHAQQIKIKYIERKNENAIFHLQGDVDTSLERIGLEEKAGMFEDVFGYKIVLAPHPSGV